MLVLMRPGAGSEPDSIVRVRGDRQVGILEVGRAADVPIFHFHGSGSSRLEALLAAKAAENSGVRLIALDRPGIGRSEPCDHARLLDWPDTVVDVADALELSKFAVLGISAGGPYALACAARIPHRLTACGLICTVAPPEFVVRTGPAWMRTIWQAARSFPSAFSVLLRLTELERPRTVAGAEQQIRWWARWMTPADRAVFQDQGVRAVLARAFSESRRQGGFAIRREALHELLPWGFAVEDVRFENVFLWHGEKDQLTPAAAARLLASSLPHCRATFYSDDGHFSTAIRHAEEILETLSRCRAD